ncbi:hypothetical protein [Paenarthrobacter sp. YJN-5]|uniref:hypothetical protein n=1 Tax=Paenarthrobacter sp. YJN-5 TaxID=2735316 RepID=UPI001878454B|nr:hypothetical protein [Paenarthrobacter sp. YJN-5]QOT19543.1 hypothetical protein HMI59_23230 [Paenarthrobacter sp. YJN-5]
MTTARTIRSEAHWDSLPIGTLARVGYIDHDDDGNEADGGTMTILRVEGNFRANAGDYMLAGGIYWTEIWGWEQGTVVLNTSTIPEPEFDDTADPSHLDAIRAVDAAIAGHAQRVADLNATPYAEYVKIPREAHPNESPAQDIVEALAAHGWAPTFVPQEHRKPHTAKT